MPKLTVADAGAPLDMGAMLDAFATLIAAGAVRVAGSVGRSGGVATWGAGTGPEPSVSLQVEWARDGGALRPVTADVLVEGEATAALGGDGLSRLLAKLGVAPDVEDIAPARAPAKASAAFEALFLSMDLKVQARRAGPDVVTGAGDDVVRLQKGYAMVEASAGGDDVYEQGGSDLWLSYHGASDALTGGIRADLSTGAVRKPGGLVDTILGIDLLEATRFDDRVIGGPNDRLSVDLWEGDDLFRGSGRAADTVLGRAGKDRAFGGGGDDRLNGGAGRDLLSGGRGDDLLAGNAGGDRLLGGRGGDHIDGGAGDDLLRLGRDRAEDVVALRPGDGVDRIEQMDLAHDTFLLLDGLGFEALSFKDVAEGAAILLDDARLALVVGVSAVALEDAGLFDQFP